MKNLITTLSAAMFAAMLLPACVDTHDDLPYVDPNIQQQQPNPSQQDGDVLISEKFNSSLGGCKSVGEGAAFVIDHSKAKISGYENNVYTPTTAYLVTSTIDLSSVDAAYYSFEHIIAYEKGDVLENEVFVVSTDYVDDATKATWTALPITAEPNSGKPSDWNAFTKVTFNIPAEYLKSGVTFAFRYKSTDKTAATWEIRNFVVQKGTATETVKYEKPSVRESTLENPLTISEAISAPVSETEKSYVKGYIVGYIAEGNKIPDDAKFTADGCSVETNILIADNANEKDVKKCIPVQLVASTKHRTALNLKDNPSVLGKAVVIGGYIQSYMGVNGLKSPFYSALEGKVIDSPAVATGFDGDDFTKEKVTEINADFTKSSDKFSVYNFLKPDNVAHVWAQTSQFGMKATASVSKVSYESKSWVISPSVDLSAYDKVEFYFDHAANYLSEGGTAADCAVYVSTDYQGGDPAQATWTKLDLTTWAKDWTYVDNTLDLTAYKGDNVHVAFEYTSTTTNACTFEIKNVYLGVSRAAETPVSGFDGESTVKTATLPFEHNFKTAVSLGDFLVYDSKRFASKDEHIWIAGNYGATAVANAESESWLISPNFSLESGKEYELKFINWYKNAATPADVYKAYIVENFAGNLAAATLTPLAMTFGNANRNNEVTIDMTQYAGKTFAIAYQYTSSAEEKGTFEVISFSLKEKVQVVEPEPDVDLTEGITTLTLDEFSAVEENSMAWVRGYIVGSYTKSKNVFGAEGHENTSIIISANPNATAVTECIHVQLNTSELKDNIGLGNVPANYDKEVIIYGKKVKYCGNVNSIKPPSYIIIVNDNKAFGTKPTK